jgi:hypothetical protein
MVGLWVSPQTFRFHLPDACSTFKTGSHVYQLHSKKLFIKQGSSQIFSARMSLTATCRRTAFAGAGNKQVVAILAEFICELPCFMNSFLKLQLLPLSPCLKRAAGCSICTHHRFVSARPHFNTISPALHAVIIHTFLNYTFDLRHIIHLHLSQLHQLFSPKNTKLFQMENFCLVSLKTVLLQPQGKFLHKRRILYIFLH